MKNILRFSFLAFIITGVICAYFAVRAGVSRSAISLTMIVATVTFNLFVESLIPYGNSPVPRPYRRDIVFTLMNIFVTGRFGEIGVTLAFASLMSKFFPTATIFSSSQLGPFWLQVLLVILINEFIRYWMHRLQHKIPALWKLHAVHHSVKEIYSLNTFYSHPLDYFIRNVTSFPFILMLGFEKETVMMTIVFTGIAGIFSHSRADFGFSWMNYIFSTNQLHRWHHSVYPHEANTNYGVCLCIWDLVFRTHFLPKDRPHPEATGLLDSHPYVPGTFAEVMIYPLGKK